MDDKQFEDLTKALANGLPRRRIVKMVAGGALAGVVGLFGRRGDAAATCKPVKDACTYHKECCSGCCKDGYCKDAYYCKTTTTTTTKPPCKPEKAYCTYHKECCSGCCKDGYCKDAYYCKTTTTTTTTRTTAPPPPCFHSVGPNGGCKGACTSAGFTGQQCNPICGSGQFRGYCPVGQGGNNPCCNPGLCDPANFVAGAGGNPVYVGPTSGC